MESHNIVSQDAHVMLSKQTHTSKIRINSNETQCATTTGTDSNELNITLDNNHGNDYSEMVSNYNSIYSFSDA